ncbi:hypothetical protein STAS_14507 [Striga asiatica]|uniref:Uncharacterized protein n=1 Tax=Striga asiatica TaxID=4170 RepID=A0A5A7PYX8_STRAF|nr:hypothetical protein STAS_14507 [Striga asiatica]
MHTGHAAAVGPPSPSRRHSPPPHCNVIVSRRLLVLRPPTSCLASVRRLFVSYLSARSTPRLRLQERFFSTHHRDAPPPFAAASIWLFNRGGATDQGCRRQSVNRPSPQRQVKLLFLALD